MFDDEAVILAGELQRHVLDQARRDGELERLRRGAYRPTEPPWDEHRFHAARRRARALAAAAHRQLEADHVFSHETAAVLHGLRLWRVPTVTHVVQAYRRSGAAAADLRRHLLALPGEHRADRDGLPVTTLARTVADCARSMHPLEGLVIADDALAQGVDLQECRDVLASTRRRNGARRAAWVLDHADAGADSAWETWLRYVALRSGLPRPITQAPVVTARGVFHCDLGWPDWSVYAEFDGLSKYRDGGVRPGHDAAQELLREKERFDAIRATGVNPVRVTAVGNARLGEVARALAARFPEELRRTLRRHPLLPPPP
ncbi:MULTISPECIES: type IV toxin-antitoxin system AbiEi family antitoxin domain-containing protein [unclassified Isoptericola]|uniref:type IV toxin-antitoxin system AbiEi family antitoxin domain-containing protein n=1 Tax=unclassified Isoptericola TaxID=2623355 RepID=UPI0036621176